MYRIYTRVLDYYQRLNQDSFSFRRFMIENFFIGLVTVGKHLCHWEFPSRAIGGWWWIWRFRWEIIANWFEFYTVQWCRNNIKSGMFVLDIGAHIGITLGFSHIRLVLGARLFLMKLFMKTTFFSKEIWANPNTQM